MRSLVILVLLFSSSSFAKSGPKVDRTIWTKCKVDTDCTVAAGACGPAAVNKKYKTQFEEHALQISKYVDCMPQDEVLKNAICYKKTCTLK